MLFVPRLTLLGDGTTIVSKYSDVKAWDEESSNAAVIFFTVTSGDLDGLF